MIYRDKQYDEERALYDVENAEIINCIFAGEADGESAIKECRNIKVRDCEFHLRYPFWHVNNADIDNCSMTESCRAALWYDQNVNIRNSRLHGIKALRECREIKISDCDLNSDEFAWRCGKIDIKNSVLNSQYAFFECRDVNIENLSMTGKYSFQYVENMTVRNSEFKTKDAFWHSKNVTVYDSVVYGEYLGWYSENLKLVNCKIAGTQPLCYCKGLILENCTMIDTDLSFENSEVEATVSGEIVSVKNPLSGYIKADKIGEIIFDEKHKISSRCKIHVG